MSKFITTDDYFSFAKTLSVIPTEDLLTLLRNHKITIPTYAHRFVLRETIQPKVFQSKLYETYTDEQKYRLRGFKDYSLYLLEKLISDYNLDFDAARYKETLFNLLFLNRELYGFKNAFIDDLEKLKYKYAVDFEKINYRDFITQFQDILFEPKGYLDGVSLKILKDVLIFSCTLGDLRGLGEKYGVKVPRRINKGRLIEILAARFRLSGEEAELLNDKSVLELEIYAKEKGFNISIDLKKSDMVEYIIFELGRYHQEMQRDQHDYQIPKPTDPDSVEIDVMEFEGNDQDIPVVELEEEVEEVPVVVEEDIDEISPVSEPAEEPVEQPLLEPIIEEEPAPVEPPVEKVEPALVVETPKKAEPVKETLIPEEFSDQEKELLDEKINLIIKKYHKQKRRRRFWTAFTIIFAVLVLGFVGYCYLYYTVIDIGKLPFNIPVFWQ
ncbi:MAG: hypothetical protein WC351_00750 [Candidatus Izemoplasmatales bacterium]|jgi:hypothetical protein